jgi:dolichol kinase
MNEVKTLLILSSYFLLVFVIGEICYRYLGAKAEYTRKWSHMASGFLSLLFPFYFQSALWVGIICGLFMMVLLLSKRFGLLPSINAVDRHTHGSALFPVAVFMAFCAYKLRQNELIYFYLPILTLAICDVCAALVGKAFPIKKIQVFGEKKSLGGFLAFIVSSVLLNYTLFLFDFRLPLVTVVAVSVVAAVVELICPKGFDNIGIPLAVIVALYLFS